MGRMLVRMLSFVGLVLGHAAASRPSQQPKPEPVPFSSFTKTCERGLPRPLARFYGARPHPDLSMVEQSVLWSADDPNIAILPKWSGPGRGARPNRTTPFVDTHVAVRFLGGVVNRSVAIAPGCADRQRGPQPSAGVDRKGIWCDLVVRAADGSLRTRFDLVHSRLDRFYNNGVDLMIVLDDVPWAFVNANATSGPCPPFGCQYLPPDDPAEFAGWVGVLAAYLVKAYGPEYASRIRWRLGTEANGPRWSNHGALFEPYLRTYALAMQEIRQVIPAAQVGASNWVEVVDGSGNLTAAGSDHFQYAFYTALAADRAIPLDWVSVSHYGGGGRAPPRKPGNFPGADYVERTPFGASGAVELSAMRDLARRPNATLEVMEWSILTNELHEPTTEPSSVGTAWSAQSVAEWMCHGVDRIFHWETGTTLVNSSGDGRLVNFYEQWAWNMAFLELFLGGQARFATWAVPAPSPTSPDGRTGTGTGTGTGAPTIALIESVKEGAYYALIAAVGHNRTARFRTSVSITTDAPFLTENGAMLEPGGEGGALIWEQYVMNSSYSVIEAIVRELTERGEPGMLAHDDGLPYDTGRLLTPAGRRYAEAPENLDRYWRMHAATFQPRPFEGSFVPRESGRGAGGELKLDVSAFSVTVVSARRRGHTDQIQKPP